MSLSRATCLVFGFVVVGCGGSTDSGTDSTQSALEVVAASSDAASLTVSSDDGTCKDFRDLAGPHKDELRSLCPEGQIPIPSNIDGDGCDRGQAKSITFTCNAAKLPGAPGACRKIPVKDDHHCMGDGGAESMSALPDVICPMLGGAPPGPPPGADGGRPPPPPPLPPPDGDDDGARRGPPPGGPELECCPPPPPPPPAPSN
jgi:hypothetical protein